MASVNSMCNDYDHMSLKAATAGGAAPCSGSHPGGICFKPGVICMLAYHADLMSEVNRKPGASGKK